MASWLGGWVGGSAVSEFGRQSESDESQGENDKEKQMFQKKKKNGKSERMSSTQEAFEEVRDDNEEGKDRKRDRVLPSLLQRSNLATTVFSLNACCACPAPQTDGR